MPACPGSGSTPNVSTGVLTGPPAGGMARFQTGVHVPAHISLATPRRRPSGFGTPGTISSRRTPGRARHPVRIRIRSGSASMGHRRWTVSTAGQQSAAVHRKGEAHTGSNSATQASVSTSPIARLVLAPGSTVNSGRVSSTSLPRPPSVTSNSAVAPGTGPRRGTAAGPARTAASRAERAQRQ